MSRIKPLESKEHKRQALVVKLSFLGLVVALVFFMQLYLSNKPISPPPLEKKVAKSNPTVLGVKSQEDLSKIFGAQLEDIKNKLDNFAGVVQSEGEVIFDETSEDVKEEFYDTVFETAVEPIITQIQNLPESQQSQIKQAICE